MTDGASESLPQDPTPAITIKTWARSASSEQSGSRAVDQHHDLLQQYTRYLEELSSGTQVVTHSVDYLRVSRATTQTDFRWFSQASQIPDSDIAKYTLTRRSRFIHEHDAAEDVYDLDELQDFHAAQLSSDTKVASRRSRLIQPKTKPLHTFGRKSTGKATFTSSQHTTRSTLSAFRKLFAASSSQDTSNESIHSSTPQTSRKRRHFVVDSPAVSSAFQHSSDASPSSSRSSSPPFVQSKAIPRLPGIANLRGVEAELRGRQPLQLKADSLVKRTEMSALKTVASVNSRSNNKTALRPITRKISANGIPLPAAKDLPLSTTVGTVISNARRLQAFGGSWPFKPKNSDTVDVSKGRSEDEHEETTENIEDYTFVIDSASSSPVGEGNYADMHGQIADDGPEDSRTNAREDSTSTLHIQGAPLNSSSSVYAANYQSLSMDVSRSVSLPPRGSASGTTQAGSTNVPPFRSTNLPSPPAPASFPSGLETTVEHHNAEGETVPEDDAHAAPSMLIDIPEISITLPTAPSRSQISPTPMRSAPRARTPALATKTSNFISITTFLALAFEDKTGPVTSVYRKVILPSRSVPKFRSLSTSIDASTVQRCFVQEQQLTEGGLFGEGYLGRGRRGFWELPLDGGSLSGLAVSRGFVLGLSDAVVYAPVSPGTIFWTLPRLRYLIARLDDLARSGRFGVVAIFTVADAHGIHSSLGIICQSSMALMLRTVLSNLACPFDAEGNECDRDLGLSEGGNQQVKKGPEWLNSRDDVNLVWWDEIERRPVLCA